MKYSIEINQLVLAETNLDVVDCSILNFIIFICLAKSEKIEKQRKNGFTWIDYEYLLSEMPLLRIKSKSALSSRIKKIEKAGYIVIQREGHQKIYVKLTDRIDELFTNKNSAIHDRAQLDNNKDNIDNIYIDNNHNTTNNSEVSVKESFKTFDKQGEKITITRKEIDIIVDKIIRYYKNKINERALATSKVKDKIKTRLEEYSQFQLASAIKRFSNNDWRMEHNFDKGISWFFRSEDQIATFLQLKEDMKTEKINLINHE